MSSRGSGPTVLLKISDSGDGLLTVRKKAHSKGQLTFVNVTLNVKAISHFCAEGFQQEDGMIDPCQSLPPLTGISYLVRCINPTWWLVPQNPGLEQGHSYYQLPSRADTFPYLLGPAGF